ncbi:MAG: FAD-dependent oxidoreductase [Eubacteriales bacterium]
MIHKAQRETFPNIEHRADFCVVGGGLAGICAAITAARHGARVVLIQDRPVLGGNASSEVRMWIRGAHGKGMRECGILEELALENQYRNPTLNFSIWDSVLYGAVSAEDNITLLLNCSVLDAVVKDGRVVSVTGWQSTTQSYHTVYGDIFADCSGDSVLAPLTGAEWRMGREASDEFGEGHAPVQADKKTMGMSCLIQARQTSRPVSYTPPEWARRFDRDSFPFRLNTSNKTAWQGDNFWWMELGGEHNSISDTEKLRHELLKVAFGVWDYIKNSGDLEAECWELAWVGFLPGKRESRRYVGDHILTQGEVEAGGKFPDIIAYGGWSMDDHHPAGFDTREKPTIFHPAPSPYGIPYRCLYSKNIENFMFAGRNISVSHMALSSTRVMATCALLGQAAGTAAALAVRLGKTPRQVGEEHISLLQQILMEDDCWLPGIAPDTSEYPSQRVTAKGEGELNADERGQAWSGSPDSTVEVELDAPAKGAVLRVVFDSELDRESMEGQRWNVRTFPMRCNIFADDAPVSPPARLTREYKVEAMLDGGWTTIREEGQNRRRLVKIPLPDGTQRVRLTLKSAWCGERVYLYSASVRNIR